MTSFLRMSAVLTGEDNLPPSLADEYLAFLQSQPEGAQIDELLLKFEGLEQSGLSRSARVQSEIVESEAFGPLVQRILILWFTAAFTSSTGTTIVVGAEPYFQALLWPTVRAHAPGLSGGYFGYWAYPPEN